MTTHALQFAGCVRPGGAWSRAIACRILNLVYSYHLPYPGKKRFPERDLQVQTAELRAAAGQTSLMETLLPVNAVQ